MYMAKQLCMYSLYTMPLLVFEQGMFTGRNDKVSQMQQQFSISVSLCFAITQPSRCSHARDAKTQHGELATQAEAHAFSPQEAIRQQLATMPHRSTSTSRIIA